MLIAIIADVHDNFANLETFLAWAHKNEVDGVISCGDMTTKDSLELLASKFTGRIDMVRGNAEIYTEKEIQQFPGIKYHGRIARLELDKMKIGVCHEPYLIEKVLENEKLDLVFYGHTHKPWKEVKDDVQLINPGTLGGVFQKATFATYDTENQKLKLHILDFLQ